MLYCKYAFQKKTFAKYDSKKLEIYIETSKSTPHNFNGGGNGKGIIVPYRKG